MALELLHDRLLRLDSLREQLIEYGMPSSECLRHAAQLTRRGSRSLEIGFSVLSLQMMQSAAVHQAVLPTQADFSAISGLCEESGISLEHFEPIYGALPESFATLPAASFDHVMLSAPAAFPLFFAAAFAAFRALKIGGRLTVRGAGPWTIEQLKNFLRNDPAWRGFQPVAPDAICVSKASAESSDWRAQPYISANSSLFSAGTIADASARSLHSRIANFSTTTAELAERKRSDPARPVVGLVGYYGFGNYGDELFRLGFEAGLPEVRLQVLHDIPRRPYYLDDKRKKVSGVEAIIIGGGDLVIPGYWTDFYFEEEFLDKPVYIHGVGVPRWTGGDGAVLKRMRAFFQHANIRYINVRDEESAEWIRTHMRPNVPVDMSPDIVCGMDLPPAIHTGDQRDLVLGLVTRRQNESEAEYAHLHQLIGRARESGYRVRQIIAGTGLVGEEDYQDAVKRRLPVNEIYRVETIEEITSTIATSDLVASMKFHGCVVGVISGRPTLGLLTTDKFKNFYRALGTQQMLAHFNQAETAKLLDQPLRKIDEKELAGLRHGARSAMQRLRQRLKDDLRPS